MVVSLFRFRRKSKKIHHEDTKDTKKSASGSFFFVLFVPSWCIL